MKGLFTFISDTKEETISILKLPFKRKLIIDKSIELYGEKDPCIIYSTYCNQILGKILLEEINNKFKNSIVEFDINSIPIFIKNKIIIDKNVKKIIIK